MDRSESSEQNLKTVLATHVSAKNATIRSVNYNPLSGNDEITLFWKISDTQLQEDCAKALTLYTSSLNTDAKYFVDDPIGSREEYRGRWRNSSVQMIKHGDEPGILQKLTRGYLREIPPYDEDDDVARIIGMRVDPTTGKYVVVRAWDGVDPDYVEEAVRARKALVQVTRPAAQIWSFEQHYVPDPRAGEKRFQGLYAVSDVTATPLEDGAFRVSETLTEIIQVGAYTDLAAETPLVTQSRETMELFGLQPGDDDSMAFVFSKLSNDSRAACMSFKAADLATMLTTETVQAWATGVAYKVGDIISNSIDGASGPFVCTVNHTSSSISTGSTEFVYWAPRNSFVFASSIFQEQPDNTAKFTVLFRRVHWQKWTDAVAIAPRRMAIGNPEHAQQTIELQWLGITTADFAVVQAAVAAADALILAAPVSLTGYVAAATSIRDNGNGSLTVTIQAKKVLLQTANNADMDRPHDFVSAKVLSHVVTYEDYSLATVNALATTPPADGTYTFISCKVTGPTSTGLYGATLVYELTAYRSYANSEAPSIIDVSLPGGTQKGQSESYLLIKKDDADNAVSDLSTPSTGFVVQGVNINDNRNGSVDVSRSQKVKYTYSVAEGGAVTTTTVPTTTTITPKDSVNGSDGVVTVDVPRIATADALVMIKKVAAAGAGSITITIESGEYGAGTYTISSVRNSDNGDGTHDLTFVYRDRFNTSSQNVPLFEIEITKKEVMWDETPKGYNVDPKPTTMFETVTSENQVEKSYWRVITTTITSRLWAAKNGAQLAASTGLVGSFCRYNGNNTYYSEEVKTTGGIVVSKWTNRLYDGVAPAAAG